MQKEERAQNIIFFTFIPVELTDTEFIFNISSTAGIDQSCFEILQNIFNLPTNYKLIQCSSTTSYNAVLKSKFSFNKKKFLVWSFEGKKTINKFFDIYLQKTAFVTGIPKKIDLSQIRKAINDVGGLIELYVSQSKNGINRHYGFAIFKSLEDFTNVIEKKNFKLLNNLNGKKVKLCCKQFQTKQIDKFKYSLEKSECQLPTVPRQVEGGYPDELKNFEIKNRFKKGKKDMILESNSQKNQKFSEEQKNHHYCQLLTPFQITSSNRTNYYYSNNPCPPSHSENVIPQSGNYFEFDEMINSLPFREEREEPYQQQFQSRIRGGFYNEQHQEGYYNQASSARLGSQNWLMPVNQALNHPEEGIQIYSRSGLGVRQSARTYPVLEKVEENHTPQKKNLVLRWGNEDKENN